MDFSWPALVGLISMLWGGMPADIDSTPESLLEAVYRMSPAAEQQTLGANAIYSDRLLNLFMQHEIDIQVTLAASSTRPPPLELIPFDPLTLGSEPHNVVISEPDIRGHQATTIVSFDNANGPVQLSVFLVEQNAGWRIDDVAAFSGSGDPWLLSRLLQDDTAGAD